MEIKIYMKESAKPAQQKQTKDHLEEISTAFKEFSIHTLNLFEIKTNPMKRL